VQVVVTQVNLRTAVASLAVWGSFLIRPAAKRQTGWATCAWAAGQEISLLRHTAMGSLVLLGLTLAMAACASDPDADVLSGLAAHGRASGSASLQGDVSGNWKAATDEAPVCGAGEVKIPVVGPAQGDIGYLIVKSDKSIWLDAEKYGDFYGDGAAFHPNSGFVVDADIATLRGKHAHVSGTFTC
jgi:hypothetical protein